MIRKLTMPILGLMIAALSSCNNSNREERQNEAIRETIYNISALLTNPDSVPALEPTADSPIEIRLPKEKVLFNPSDIVEVSHYLPLETRADVMMGQVSDIRFHDDYIFLRDNSRKGIFIFDQAGKFVRQIRHDGNGPGEYNRIMSYTVLDSQVLIYDDINKKVHAYSFEDRWLKAKDMAIMFNNFEILPDGSYFMYTGSFRNEYYPQIRDHEFLFGFPDSLITHKAFLRSKGQQNMSKATIRAIYPYEDTILFRQNYGHTIYQLTPNKQIKPRYKVVFDKYVTDEALMNAHPGNNDREIVADGYQFLTGKWLETNKYALFSYPYLDSEIKGTFVTECFYSKERKSIFSYDATLTNHPFLDYNSPVTTFQDMFVSILWPYKILEKKEQLLKQNANNPEVLRILNQLKEEDNPVLMFFKIKENNPLF